jgi:D-alanine-D-alanine ligase
MKIHIGALFGGRSVEHEISVLSALQVIKAIDAERFQVSPIYISKEGVWHTGDALLELDNYQDIEALKARCARVIASGENGQLVLSRNPPLRFGKNIVARIDAAFPVTHGTYGEDGCLQGLLEMFDVPYVGCDVTASALGMDKIRFKEIGKARELPMTDYLWFFSKAWHVDPEPIRQRIRELIGYPVIVKPANLGSSIGVSAVAEEDLLDEAIALTASFADRVIVEKLVPNVLEINCAVLGDNDESIASVCEEPLHESEFLTYAEKYQSKGGGGAKGMQSAKRRIPADIDEGLARRIQTLARETFAAIGASGVARVDFLVDRQTGEVFVNEINTIPGSMAFYLWTPSNLGFDELIAKLVDLALKRARQRAALMRSNPVNILALSAKGGGAKR